MTVSTSTQRPRGEDCIRSLRSVMASEDDWKILSILMLPEFADGITLNDNDVGKLFDAFAPSRGQKYRKNNRIAELKSKVKSMYRRKILSRNWHKYSVRS